MTNIKKIKREVSDEVGLVGRYRLTKAKLEKPEHFLLQAEIVVVRTKMANVIENMKNVDSIKLFKSLNETRKELSEEMMRMTRLLNSICKTEVSYYANIVPTVARTMIANNLADGSPTNAMLISHGALGSNGTAVANGDLTLGTETYRNAIASITNASNITYATAFYTAVEVSGTFAEAGIFSDGTGSVDTGILVSHVLISVTKSGCETLTIDWELTIN